MHDHEKPPLVECPDCGDGIEEYPGAECPNCGHVYWPDTTTITIRGNIQFSLQNVREGFHVFSAKRISDDRHIGGQLHFKDDPSAYMDEMIADWNEKYPGLDAEPPAVHCLACNEVLIADHDTNYQFDNALWIGFHGGYGMFVDNMDFPINIDENQVPNYVPKYREVRILPGRPDHEAVICHKCAHVLCAAIPWIDRLIQPLSSHAHRVDTIPGLLAEGHQGWDLDRHREGSDE